MSFDVDNPPHVDLLLLEGIIEPISGLEIIAAMRKVAPELPVIWITCSDTEIREARKSKVLLFRGIKAFELSRTIANELLTQGDVRVENSTNFLQYNQTGTKELAHRIEYIEQSLTALRINSLLRYVDELSEIRRQLLERERLSQASISLKAPALKVLQLLEGIYDAIASQTGGQVLIAGAVAGVVGFGGWPTVTAYGLTMAAWQGKDAFMKALDSLAPKARTTIRRK